MVIWDIILIYRITMKKIFLLYLVLFALAIGSVKAQPKEKVQILSIESIINDEKGNPIPGAKIYGKEGASIVKSDAAGHFVISVPKGTSLLIEATGYESKVIGLPEAGPTISLRSTPYMMGEKDNVKVAFATLKRRQLGFVSVVEPDEISAYDNTQYVPDALTGRIPGMVGSSSMRGLGNAMVVLDGIPRYASISDINLNMEEIDQISVLKDVNAVALYGSQARNGVIVITTKRGKAHKRDFNISAYYGIAKPKMLPSYLGSANYMVLYNEACRNDGLPEKFDALSIENYRSGNPYRYPSIDYYSSDYLKSYKNYSKILAEFSGGNEFTTFYANVGWGRDGSLMNFGQGLGSSNQRFNERANVDIKINDFIKSNVDVAGVFEFNKGPIGNYFSEASTQRPYLYTPLLPFDLFDQSRADLNNMVKSRKNDVDNMYLLGGNAQMMTSAFGNGYAGGYNQVVNRTMQFNNGYDVDLSMITKGLSLKNNVSYDFYNRYTQSVTNSYSVYEPVWSATADSIQALKQYGTDSRPGTQNVGSPDFLRRVGVFTQLNYDRTFADVHHIKGTLLGFINWVKLNGTVQPDKNSHIGLMASYDYKATYFVNFSGAYVNSTQLAPGHKAGFAPTIGLAWVISNENFLSGSNIVNYLKLKASAGIINTLFGLSGFFLYDNVFTWAGSTNYGAGNYTWADGAWGNSATISIQGSNPSLSFEKRKEINFGVEGKFINNSIGVEANVFNFRITDKIAQRTSLYPSEYVDFIPYSNYGIDAYYGAELGLTLSKRYGNFSFDAGVTGMYLNSKVIQKEELYAEDYLYRKGHSVDAQFGLQANGLFQDASDIKNSAFQSFGEVRPGDIKYVDQNKDGVIDNNDQIQIGRYQAPYTYGLNLKLSYKSFSFFVLGVGSNGGSGNVSSNYYWVDGDKKYSNQVLNRWTVDTKTTATYPRLSTKTSQNNFRTSSFWFYKNNFFSLNRMQLTYELPEKLCRKISMKNMSIYVSGSGLATISKNKDILELSVGAEPQYRYFTLGVVTKF
jgi:TonB-linked SusC/RagA family outer membrane protein